MSISDLELSALKSRVLAAVRTNSSIANVESHIQQLKSELSECPTWLKGTPATEYLHSLVLAVEKNRSEGDSWGAYSETPAIETTELPSEPDSELHEVTADMIEEDSEPQEEAPEAGSDDSSKRSRKSRRGRR